MIKLETKATIASAVVTIEIRSRTDVPSIHLSAEEAGSFANSVYTVDPSKKKQLVTFTGEDGESVSLLGTVDDAAAISIQAAYKVVVDVRLSENLSAAREAGRVSRAYVSMAVVGVVEVWETATKCLWRAEKASPGGKEIDLSGTKARLA